MPFSKIDETNNQERGERERERETLSHPQSEMQTERSSEENEVIAEI